MSAKKFIPGRPPVDRDRAIREHHEATLNETTDDRAEVSVGLMSRREPLTAGFWIDARGFGMGDGGPIDSYDDFVNSRWFRSVEFAQDRDSRLGHLIRYH